MRYNAKKVTIDNVCFDSIHESQVYVDLRIMQRDGMISKLQCHPKFVFVVNGVKVGTWKLDFAYHDKDDRVHIVDAKGFRKSKLTGKLLPRVDREFGLKKRLMLALFGLDVEIL